LSQIITKHLFRHLLVLVVFLILISLGIWQLNRLGQRRALNQAILAGLDQSPVVLSGQAVDPDELHFRPVSVTGEFDNEASIILRGRSLNAQQGADLVVPLLVDGSKQAILVNRGWIPLAFSDPEARRAYDVIGSVTIEGIANRTQTRPDSFIAPTDPTPQPGQRGLDTWFRVDIDRIQKQVDYPLMPVFIEQSANPGSTTPPIGKESVDLNDGPHLGYAIQWFTFALILAGIYSAFTWQEWKREG
jgi:surfeit locus 1 family protein